MNQLSATWQLLNQSLAQGVPAMLLYVLHSQGSSPGRQGFSMALNAKGDMAGSIGGGMMEHKFVELAREKLRQPVTETSVRRQIHDKQAAQNQSGMICSGEQTILVYRVRESEAPAVREILACLEGDRNGLLTLSPDGLAFSEIISVGKDFDYSFTSQTDWIYREKIGYRHHLHLVGGGHCALAFSRIMRMLDFYIHLYEDRADLNTLRDNPHVHQKVAVADYGELHHLVPAGAHQYVVIMTFGYRSDDLALRALWHQEYAYLGLLGSKSKIAKMLAGYRQEGIAEKRLSQIYGPVGLAINSRTPEEIAVSIAAQIIQVKNKPLV